MRGHPASWTLSGMPDGVTCRLEPYRRELTGHCRRVLGSSFEAEDAVQETMVRAWRRIDGYEGRAALRTWLHRIATNVCLDMMRRPQRRARPLAEVEPLAAAADPAERVTSRESVRLAFAAALAHLPARQRAMLVLHDVLRWRAREIAELLDTTVPAVTSGLQRARATLAACQRRDAPPPRLSDDREALLASYAEGFERHDVDALVALLRAEAASRDGGLTGAA
jgi:RNA polymerase sigma-70 factor (ECF subfamily)